MKPKYFELVPVFNPTLDLNTITLTRWRGLGYHVNYAGEEAEANARLIAAAPQMLEALEHVLRDTLANGEQADAEHVTLLTNVIYKAKGE